MFNVKNNNLFYFGIFFWSFLGYYALLLLFTSFVSMEMSRQFTVPLRVMVGGLLILLFIKNVKRIQTIPAQRWFFLFVIIYTTRLFVDYNLARHYYASFSDVFFYFYSFCVLPFLVISSIEIKPENLKVIYNSFLIGGIAFSILTIVYYGRFIGEVTRLSSSTAGESTISPLALSYCSSLVISVFTFYLLHNKVAGGMKIIIITAIALSVVPFFLGASRGSLLALMISFLVYIFVGKGVKFFLRSVVIIVIGVFGIVFLDNYFKSGLLDRFLGTTDAIEAGSSSASRIVIWKASFNQFLNNPIFGDKLKVDGIESYPHNVFIEVLQTTGIVGGIIFIALSVSVWKKVFSIAKNYKEFFWLLTIFIQSYVQHMFSGAIYTASWLWTSMALVLVLQKNLVQNKQLTK